MPTRNASCEPSRNLVWTGSSSLGKHRSDRAVHEFADRYHHERNHQGLGNRLIVPLAEQPNHEATIACRERLGGLLKYYHRPAGRVRAAGRPTEKRLQSAFPSSARRRCFRPASLAIRVASDFLPHRLLINHHRREPAPARLLDPNSLTSIPCAISGALTTDRVNGHYDFVET